MRIGLLLPCRWPLSYSQWWECEFITEGIVDNGESSPLPPWGSPLGFLVLGGSSVHHPLQRGAHAVPDALWEAAPLYTQWDGPCISPKPPPLPQGEGVAWPDPVAQHLAPGMSGVNQPLPPLQAVVFGTACRTCRRSCVPVQAMSLCLCPSSCAPPTRFGTLLSTCPGPDGASSRVWGLLGH